MKGFSKEDIFIIVHILFLLGISLVLLGTFWCQFELAELPCPLCLLQRVGYFGVFLGLLMNLRFGPYPSHYGVILISVFYTAAVALRQMALHIIPGSPTYGIPILGIHLYTWSFITSLMIAAATIIMLSIDNQYESIKLTLINSAGKQFLPKYIKLLFIYIAILLIINIFSIFLECGFAICPDDPLQYRIHILASL